MADAINAHQVVLLGNAKYSTYIGQVLSAQRSLNIDSTEA